MRENVRTKKKRLNPDGIEGLGFRESDRGVGRADKLRAGSVVVAAGRDRRNCTSMLGSARVSVDALVQLRRNT